MKKFAAAIAVTAAFTGSALAADMAPRYAKAPPPVVAVASWTGCYIGGGGGYGLWNQENTGYLEPNLVNLVLDQRVQATTSRVRFTETVTTGGRGYFGTVQGGCDYQFGVGANQFVIGAFGDYDFAEMKGNHNPPGTPFWSQEKLTDQWSIGGRIGWLVTPSLLTYFSGGYTEAKFDRQNYTNLIGPPFGIASNLYTDSRWYKGYFLGAGDEYALSFLPGLFWKTEYRFSTFNSETNAIRISTNNLPLNYTEDSKKYVHTVRSELVYRFNWGGPVVAKY